MKLTVADLHSLHDTACAAAREAGQVIANSISSSPTVHYKAGAASLAAQVVTEIDLQCDALIRAHLSASAEQFDLALLTEETPDDGQRLVKDYFWCVDPLDGTLAFTRATPGYSVAISLISQAGVPIIWVVLDPVTDTLFSAIAGQGVWRNGEIWRPPALSSENNKRGLTIHLDCSFIERDGFAEKWRTLQIWAESAGYLSLERVSEFGGVLSAISVLLDAPACYFKPPKDQSGGGSIWDFAATACIYNALGVYACDYSGKAFHFNQPDSTFMNHCGVMFASNAALAEIADVCGDA